MVTVQPLMISLSICIVRLQIWDMPGHGDIILAGQEVRGLPPLTVISAEHRELVLLSRWLQVCRGTMSAVSLPGELSIWRSGLSHRALVMLSR